MSTSRVFLMTKPSRVLAATLIVFMAATSVLSAGGQTPNRPTVKDAVSSLGLGEKAKVTVKLGDRSQLKGYVSRAGEDEFVVTEKRTGRERPVRYGEVASIKGDLPRGGGHIDLDFGTKARDVLAKTGTGKGARIAVKLADKTEVKGYVSQIEADSFVVTIKEGGPQTRIAYAEVVDIRRLQSVGADIASTAGVVGALIGLALLAVLVALRAANG